MVEAPPDLLDRALLLAGASVGILRV